MDLLRRVIGKARTQPQRVVYPEALDPRILQTAVRVRDTGTAHPILLGPVQQIRELAHELGLDLSGIPLIHPRDSNDLSAYAAWYARQRGLREAIARKLVAKPLSYGGMMVATGDADGMVAGVASATSLVIQAASLTIGHPTGFTMASSFFIMRLPRQAGDNRVFLFADPAVAIQPGPRALAEIAIATAENARRFLDEEPRVAFLSFSTKGSASHADVDKVTTALGIARELRPDLTMDGELQLDAAINPSVAARKAPESPLAGQANVLVFPDLDAANIGYKLVQYMAGAQAIGPILQGFARPVNDMSRGASVADLEAVTAITCVQAMGDSQ